MSNYEMKKEVVEACHVLSGMGYLAGIGGNLAIRVADRMAVTPSAADYFSMKPDDICIMDIHSLEVLEGDRSPSVESGLHALFFRKRPEIKASVHTHQPVASAMALLNRNIPMLSGEEQRELGEKVPVVGYGPSGTGMLVNALKKKLSPHLNGYLLRNHGIICGARSMDQAIRNVRLIEKAAARYIAEAITSNRGSRPVATVDQALASLAEYQQI
ncbi:MAG: aldose epimerase [Spirochaetaceae bacterium]|nr:aldose epimerase [Spirochaetaceae bacterium]|tara:strand:+ start:88958 stop:89602 length:645 start_codon:yes stop_codon:yes gene_type:complete